MNIRIFSSILLASTFALVSCKKELEPQQSTTTTELEAPAVAGSESAPAQAAPQMQTAPQQTTQAAMPQQAAPQTQTVAKGMNPAHGQPGHRCDIAVGAPLTSAPATNAKTQVTPQMIAGDNNTKITPAKVNADGTLSPAGQNNANPSTPALLNPASTTAAGMNPPHGQAGHRCDIAVGQPLK